MKKVLFITYGSGHVNMVVPVAKALQASGLALPVVLALTTAADVVRRAGLPLLQFKNFVRPQDQDVLLYGRALVARLDSAPLDIEESIAYLGLSFADLVAEHGLDAANAMYAHNGRQAFLPVATLRRILEGIQPDLVFATNSPRSERAAVLAARELNIPAICLVDLFAIDEVKWIGAPAYADRVCVLNPAVKAFLVKSGRLPEQVVVTGNPAFDALFMPDVMLHGAQLRAQRGWNNKRVVLWASQFEPAIHPFDGRPGDPSLPSNVLAVLLSWVQTQDDTVLCIRLRSGEQWPPGVDLPSDPRVVLTGQDWSLPPLLHASDLVVTLNSTVGLQGHLVGCRLVQVLGSVFDHAMPLKTYGISDEAVYLPELVPALDCCLALTKRLIAQHIPATEQVLDEIRDVLSV
jgi:hypothetical protein